MKHTYTRTLRYLHQPAFWILSLLITFAMPGSAIAQAASDSTTTDSTPSSPSGAVSTDAQRQILNRLKDSAAAEINRRLTLLNDAKDDLSHARTLPDAVIKTIQDEVEAEILTHVAFNKAIGSYNDLPSVRRDIGKVEAEYPRYVMTVRKGYLLATADFQTHLAKKTETIAAKIQRRLTVANNSGKDVSSVQITLNDLRTNLTAAEGLTGAVASDVPPIQLGTYETNKSVMQFHQDRLAQAHKNLQNCYNDMDTLVKAIESHGF